MYLYARSFPLGTLHPPHNIGLRSLKSLFLFPQVPKSQGDPPTPGGGVYFLLRGYTPPKIYIFFRDSREKVLFFPRASRGKLLFLRAARANYFSCWFVFQAGSESVEVQPTVAV